MSTVENATVFESERLRMRRWTLDDIDAAFEMYSDPEVMRYLGGPPAESKEQMNERLTRFINYYNGPYGAWAMVSKESDEIIGTVLLKSLPDSDKVEVGWHLGRKHWGKGYATEAGAAAVKHGFETAKLETI